MKMDNNIITNAVYYAGAVVGGVVDTTQMAEPDFSFYTVFRLGAVAFFSACSAAIGKEFFAFAYRHASKFIKDFFNNK